MSLLHVLLTHRPAAEVRAQLDYLRGLAPHATVIVAFGGPAEEWERLDAFGYFVEDARMRGPIDGHTYRELLQRSWEALRAGTQVGIHLFEFDHVLLARDFDERLEGLLLDANAGVLARNGVDRTNTNWIHAVRARKDSELLAMLSSVSVREDPARLFGGLGNGLVVSRAALEAFVSFDAHLDRYVELYLPTLLHHLGFSVADVTGLADIYDYVRWRPEFSLEEVQWARANGVFAVHPVKDARVWQAL